MRVGPTSGVRHSAASATAAATPIAAPYRRAVSPSIPIADPVPAVGRVQQLGGHLKHLTQPLGAERLSGGTISDDAAAAQHHHTVRVGSGQVQVVRYGRHQYAALAQPAED